MLIAVWSQWGDGHLEQRVLWEVKGLAQETRSSARVHQVLVPG